MKLGRVAAGDKSSISTSIDYCGATKKLAPKPKWASSEHATGSTNTELGSSDSGFKFVIIIDRKNFKNLLSVATGGGRSPATGAHC